MARGRNDPQSYNGKHDRFPGDRSGRDLPSRAEADVFTPCGSQYMPASPGRNSTTCKQPDKDEVICSLLESYLTERRATNGVIAVNTYGSQCHDINSKAREHREKPG